MSKLMQKEYNSIDEMIEDLFKRGNNGDREAQYILKKIWKKIFGNLVPEPRFSEEIIYT